MTTSNAGWPAIRIGHDLVEIARWRATQARFGDRLLQRIFTADELAYCLAQKDSAVHLAVRFAAKEAAAKALGTGIGRGVTFKDIEIMRVIHAAPCLHLHGIAAELARQQNLRDWQITLTHTSQTASAIVLCLVG